MMHITWPSLIEWTQKTFGRTRNRARWTWKNESDGNKPGIIGLSGFELKPMTGPVKIELFKNGIPDIA